MLPRIKKKQVPAFHQNGEILQNINYYDYNCVLLDSKRNNLNSILVDTVSEIYMTVSAIFNAFILRNATPNKVSAEHQNGKAS